MTSKETSDFGCDDWAWAIKAIAGELARLCPGQRGAVAERLRARIGYAEADPADRRQQLLHHLAERLADPASCVA